MNSMRIKKPAAELQVFEQDILIFSFVSLQAAMRIMGI